MNRIRLYNTCNGWIAHHMGPHAAEIKKLFGTAEILTAFTCTAHPDYVVAEISRLNPDCKVF